MKLDPNVLLRTSTHGSRTIFSDPRYQRFFQAEKS